MAIRPVLVDKRSPFFGESCALCKEPFSPGEEIIVCPEDGTRHHVFCWQANDNHCSAYGCNGSGRPILRTPFVDEDERERAGEAVDREIIADGEVIENGRVITSATEGQPASKVRTYPSSSFGCAQTCLFIAIALSIVIFAVSCFGLWAILDYLFIEVFNLPYREPLSLLIPLISMTAM